MHIYSCPICAHSLKYNTDYLVCTSCHASYTITDNTISFINKDTYWGEFDEQQMDIVLKFTEQSFDQARSYIADVLKRKSFIFDKARSDFLFFLNTNTDVVCLDVGCGLGTHSFNIAPYVRHVYGFDSSLKRIRFCNARKSTEHVANVDFIHTDFSRLPFSQGFFDIILMNGIVEWLGEIKMHDSPRDDQLSVLKVIRDLMKQSATLYIGIENRFAYVYFVNGIDHSGLRYTSLMPRWLASLYTKIRTNKRYRTYTYSVYGYKKLLHDAGFDTNKIEFYLAHPGYNKPQYIIPFDDLTALRYFLLNMTKNKGWRGIIVRYMSRYQWFLRMLRHFFYSYLIFIKK